MNRWTMAVAVLALAGCSDGMNGGDARADARGRDGFGSTDTGGGTLDASGDFDSGNPGTDSGNPGTDSGNPGTDSGNPGTDSGNPGTDSGVRVDSGNPGTDSGVRVDAGNPVDSGTGTCALAVTVTAPAEGATIPVCVPNRGDKRYYNFTATVTGGTPTSVAFDWILPTTNAPTPWTFRTGNPPPVNVTVSGSTYTARRQTGGVWGPTDPTPLGSFGNRAYNGWKVVVTATGPNGCTKTATHTFNLASATQSPCPPL